MRRLGTFSCFSEWDKWVMGFVRVSIKTKHKPSGGWTRLVPPDMGSLFYFCSKHCHPSFLGAQGSGLFLPTNTEQYRSTEPGPPQRTPCRCQDSGEVYVHRRGCIFMRGLSLDPCLLQPPTLFIPICYWLMSDAPAPLWWIHWIHMMEKLRQCASNLFCLFFWEVWTTPGGPGQISTFGY